MFNNRARLLNNTKMILLLFFSYINVWYYKSMDTNMRIVDVFSEPIQTLICFFELVVNSKTSRI